MARKWVPWWIERHRKKSALREAVRKRDGNNCWRCHQPMRFGPPFNVGKAATLEHLTAQANGGGWDLDNLVLCHVGCNRHLGINAPAQKERMRLRP